nr:SitI3 family protein [Kribbella sandramycini]
MCTTTPVQAFAHLEGKSSTGLLTTVRPDGRANLVLVEPELSVGFRFDKIAEPEPQYAELVRTVVRLLADEPGDAMLQQDFERILLLRRGTDVQLGDIWLWSNPEWLALIPSPYTRRPMPYPEDC